ncbi:MAG: phosphomevalonate kinase [Candidatus Babeliales bacterium]
MIEVKAPGKIMLAGEWSILEPGHSCIVLPVNKFVAVRIQESKKIIFSSEDIGLKNVILQWALENLMGHLTVDPVLPERLMAKFNVCFCAIKNCLQFLTEQGISIKPFELSVYSGLSGVKIDGSNFVKPGLGSSAAVTVAVCKAILKFHDIDIYSVKNLELVFKLACLSHYFASGKLGSGFDVACSAYQRPIIYRRFNAEWLENEICSAKNISNIVLLDWPDLRMSEIKLPENMQVLIGFVGYSASTTKMIGKMNLFKDSQPEIYQSIMQSINLVVLNLISAIQRNNKFQIIDLINQNRDLLANLGAESGIELETKELKRLIDSAQVCGAAAKSSGAGGGDCGIAVCFDKIIADEITDEWNRAGIKSI